MNTIRAAARALLRWMTGPGHGEAAVGDLEEDYAARKRINGEGLRAELWYLREATSLMAGLSVERVREWMGARRTALAGSDERGVDGTSNGRWGMKTMKALFAGATFSWLDVKLGLRMLRKHPGLALVSVIGMSVAIAIAGGYYGAIGAMIDPSLPLDEGDRIVSVRIADLTDPGDAMLQSAHDFVAWRNELQSIRDLSAFRNETRYLVVEGQGADLVDVAQMSAAGFRVTRVAPVLGRTLLEEDEREGAPPVVVMGYDEWQNRFDADPAILGQTVRLGSTVHTVVGVMPAEYRFPRHHRFWIPLHLNVNAYERGDGPAIYMFGRLSDGVSLEQAQAELSTIGQRNANAFPQTYERLRPMVSPYTYPFMNIDSLTQVAFFRTLQLALGLLLVVVALNVAVLVYARTTSRAGEIAVRSALGASRKRVVTQLFAEALVLSSISAILGLSLATVGLRIVEYFNDSPGGDYEMPFWVEFGLTPGVVMYVAGLAILAGLIIGVLPGLKVTSRLQAGLQQLTSSGSTKQLGRTWTGLIVLQVGIAVAILPFAVYVAGQSVMVASGESQYPAEQILRANLRMRPELGPSAIVNDEAVDELEAALVDRTAELLRRLDSDAGIAGASVATSIPGQGPSSQIEIEGGSAQASGAASAQNATEVTTNRIGPDLFAVHDVPMVAGREFVEADALEGSAVAIVDRVFAEEIFGGAALGRRIRLADTAGSGEEPEPGPWLEIVGVVPDFSVDDGWGPPDPKLYLPLSLTEPRSYLTLAVRARDGSMPTIARQLTEIAAAVDPSLQLDNLNTAADVDRLDRQFLLFVAFGVAAVTSSVLLLSATGIYAMMSFMVAGRRREIGIRTALGADRGRVLAGVFARAGAQLGAGVLAGLVLAAVVNQATGGSQFGDDILLLFPVVALVMISVGLLSALGPARRALDVQPTEALRGE
jgi:predicted permease